MTAVAGYDPSASLADLVAAAENQPSTGLIARSVLRDLGLGESAGCDDITRAIRAAVLAAAEAVRADILTPARDAAKTRRQREAAIDRLYKVAKSSVGMMWNNPRQLLGPVLYRALIGEELLRLVARQDETISADAVRAMAGGFWERLRDDQEVNGA